MPPPFSDPNSLNANTSAIDYDPEDELPTDEELQSDSDSDADQDREDDDDNDDDEHIEDQGEKIEVDDDSDQSKLPTCPICFKPWTSDGPHRICCFPCGHIYGRSCLEKWIERCGGASGKCPQCNRKYRVKQIINLYAPVIAAPNDSQEKDSDVHEQNERPKVHDPPEETSVQSNHLHPTFEGQQNSCAHCSELQEIVINMETNLRTRIESLENQFHQLMDMRNEIHVLRDEMAEKVADLQRKLAELKNNMDEKTQDLQSEMADLRSEMDGIKNEITGLRRMVVEARRMQDELHTPKRRRM